MSEETSISRHGSFVTGSHGEQIILALDRALALDSMLPDWVLDVQGMSGRLYRRFVNNLVRAFSDARYLEIGSWAGSTACAAMGANAAKITCVDNWSLFAGPKDLFLENVGRAKSEVVDFLFLESDFREVDYSSIGKYNIYLFDGPHEYEDQYDGVKIAQSALDREHILIVDDWNWESVRKGTWDALQDSNCEVIDYVEIRTTQDNSHPTKAFQKESAWHNGYFVGAIRKRSEKPGSGASSAAAERSLRAKVTELQHLLTGAQSRADDLERRADDLEQRHAEELAKATAKQGMFEAALANLQAEVSKLGTTLDERDQKIAKLESAIGEEAKRVEQGSILLSALCGKWTAGDWLLLARSRQLLGQAIPTASEQEFVEAVYDAILSRATDPIGAEHSLARLAQGHSRLSVLLDIAGSPEAQHLSASAKVRAPLTQ